jgi:hypothetical protein
VTEEAPRVEEPAPPRWRKLARRFAPYIVAGVAIFGVLRKYSPSQIAVEVERGNAFGMVPFTVGMLTFGIVLVALADWIVIRACTGNPSFPVVLRGKIGASTLNVVSYAAQAGGYGVWIARVTGTRAVLTGGIVLYILASEACALAIVASAAVWLGGLDVPASLRIAPPIVAGVLVALMLVGRLELVPEDRLPRVFRPWRQIRPARALGQLAIRTTHMFSLSLFAWGAANAFGMPVPLGVMCTYFPLVLFVGSLPVNVMGLGAVQHVWLLLEPWSQSGEQVLAFSLLWQLMAAVGIVARGLPFVRRVVTEIDEGRASDD